MNAVVVVVAAAVVKGGGEARAQDGEARREGHMYTRAVGRGVSGVETGAVYD